MKGEEQEGGSIDGWKDGGRQEREGRGKWGEKRERERGVMKTGKKRDREKGTEGEEQGEGTRSTNVRPASIVRKGGLHPRPRAVPPSGVRRQRFPSEARRDSVMAQGRGYPSASFRVLFTKEFLFRGG